MSRQTIIILSGKSGSGKDTVAEYLSDNYWATTTALADPLKDFASEFFGVPLNFFYDVALKDALIDRLPRVSGDRDIQAIQEIAGQSMSAGHWTPRGLCLAVGALGRAVDPDFWVYKSLEKLEAATIGVVTDVRYKSELDTLQNIFPTNLVSIRICRKELQNPHIAEIPSESDLDNYKGFTYTVRNNGTLEDLYKSIDEIMQEIRG